MSTFAQNFQQEMPGLWTWRTECPILRGMRAKFELSVYGCWEDDDHNNDQTDLDVYIESFGNDAVSICHQIAWNYIVDNPSEIEPVIRAELFKHHMMGWGGFQRDMSDETDGWNEVRDLVAWDCETAINDLYTLITITLGPDVRDDCAVTTFHFASSWDPEHGVDISLHRKTLAE